VPAAEASGLLFVLVAKDANLSCVWSGNSCEKKGDLVMRRLLMMLLFVSGSALACGSMEEWDEVFSGEGVTTYADTSTINRKGNKVKMWWLSDYEEEQEIGSVSYQSAKFISEFDCVKNQFRQIYGSWHSDNMAESEAVSIEYDLQKWTEIEADSAEESLLKAACDSK
jgi:hypothetical protein